jgi:hypothetical protein
MPDRNDSDRVPSPTDEGRKPEQGDANAPNLGPAERDFGDSAGYGGGGSTRDYQEVVGENPVTGGRLNPLDAVIPPETQDNEDEKRRGSERDES